MEGEREVVGDLLCFQYAVCLKSTLEGRLRASTLTKVNFVAGGCRLFTVVSEHIYFGIDVFVRAVFRLQRGPLVKAGIQRNRKTHFCDFRVLCDFRSG